MDSSAAGAPTTSERTPLDERSKALRRLAVEALAGGGRGHIGSTFSLIEILRVLYDDVLRVDPERPRWEERDRLLLSKGHGCIALYAMLADKGFFPREELSRFCHHDGNLGGHPDHVKVPGVEASTGSLGHGASIGIGMALAASHAGSSRRVFVVLGDGECNEGAVWEAAMSANKHRLGNLAMIIDYNRQQSYGPTREVQDLEPFADKWRSFGASVREVDGHHVGQLRAAFEALPFAEDRYSVVICHTVKGKGLPEAEGNPRWHHMSRISEEKIQEMLRAIADYE